MVVIITRAVNVLAIVAIPVMVLVAAGRVLVAGLTTLGVSVRHVRLLSKRCRLCDAESAVVEHRTKARYSWIRLASDGLRGLGEPWSRDLDLGTDASGATPSSA